MRLTGKTAIVTGAASGIFTSQGARVMIAGLGEAGAKALAEQMGDPTVACHVDISENVSVNPVAGETALLKSLTGKDTPEMRAKFLSTIPLGRFSTPQGTGNAACFLCPDETPMITGVATEADGGRSI